MKSPNYGVWIFAFLAGCWLFASPARAGLKPFPITANHRGTVTCLENPAISYDIYLPATYSTNGPPLPILYTLNPSGGGLVSSLSNACAGLNMITVGVISSKNGASLNVILRDFYAVPHDVRQRVRFDPSAEFVAGFSGGGENAYIFTRFWAQHVAGIFAMSGWMGCTYGPDGHVTYFTTDRMQTNLLVARTTGTSDDYTQTNFLGPDGTNLVSCGDVVKDWTFSGGHAIPPDSQKTTSLSWLLNNRTLPGARDESNSLAQATNWYARVAGGQKEGVLRECMTTLMNQPRTWFALQAQLVMDDLMTNYNSFRSLNVSNLAQGDFASDLFYYAARGAATNNDTQQYQANLKALTGINATSGNRAGDIYYLLTKFNYPAPQLRLSADPTAALATAWVQEDAPGLAYALQSVNNLGDDWQDISPDADDTNAIWSVTMDFDPASDSGFYRVGTTPIFGISPGWPNGISSQ